MSLNTAPIVLFVYNRLEHTKLAVEALLQNALADQSDLIIYSDGPKFPQDRQKVNELRKYLQSIEGFRSINIIESQTNKGLAESIIFGVSQTLMQYESIIVLEDDMVTSPYFLTFMNEALMLYEKESAVVSIHAYVYPILENLPTTFFLKGADCWGWATWKRGWKLFEPDGHRLLNELIEKKLTHEFDFYGAYPYTTMLKKQIQGKNNSWAIRWYASAFLKNKLTLYPGKSLIRNIGNDTSGTHSWDSKRFHHDDLADFIELHHLEAKEDTNAKRIVSNYLKKSTPSTIRKIIYRLKFILNSFK